MTMCNLNMYSKDFFQHFFIMIYIHYSIHSTSMSSVSPKTSLLVSSSSVTTAAGDAAVVTVAAAAAVPKAAPTPVTAVVVVVGLESVVVAGGRPLRRASIACMPSPRCNLDSTSVGISICASSACLCRIFCCGGGNACCS
ncbi:hypothetical protein BDB00DRAFT_804528 [Zychaea mexicana]|uniref:uncharacterized protein n=1 Tax=Zychaea mexicana TaxID=64656 RepID=UPI0022FE8E4B|nr:uncharacterized protein BDB00DRAFT_804528 [Zychaea mexicana]KAI9497463.1 hypothetical protein BDB00DRAFT_804528 [Zychaea mexicana]